MMHLAITGLRARWADELTDGWYPIPTVAAWSGVGADTLERLLRADDHFEVRAGADMPDHVERVPRGRGGGFWPFVRLRGEAELRDVRRLAERRAGASAELAGWIKRHLPDLPITVTYDEGRGAFVVRGATPDDVARASLSEDPDRMDRWEPTRAGAV
jgi:hypothetical protein